MAEEREACDLAVVRKSRICQIEQLRGMIAHIEAEQEQGDARIYTKISSMIHVKGSMSSLNSNRALFELLLTGVFWKREKDGPLLIRCLRNPLFELALRHWQPANQQEAIEFFLRACDGVNRGDYPCVLKRCPLLLRTMLGQWCPGHGAEAIPYKKQIHKRFDMYSYFFLAFDLTRGQKSLPRREEIEEYFSKSHPDSEEQSSDSDSDSDSDSEGSGQESEDIESSSENLEDEDMEEDIESSIEEDSSESDDIESDSTD